MPPQRAKSGVFGGIPPLWRDFQSPPVKATSFSWLVVFYIFFSPKSTKKVKIVHFAIILQTSGYIFCTFLLLTASLKQKTLDKFPKIYYIYTFINPKGYLKCIQ